MYWGMACHSWISAASNCWRVTGCTALERTHLPSSAHKCSIGFRSGLRDGHGMTSTHCWRRKSVESLPTCGLTLSCWNSRKPCCAMKGNTSDGKMVSRYATALRRSVQRAMASYGQGWLRPTPWFHHHPIGCVPRHSTVQTSHPDICRFACYRRQRTG